jgi:hypothetical protein
VADAEHGGYIAVPTKTKVSGPKVRQNPVSFDVHSSQATLFWLSMTDVERDHIVERTLLTTRSIEFDAVLIAGGTAGLRDVKLSVLLQEAFRHCKALAA